MAPALAVLPAIAPAPLILPVHHVLDGKAKLTPGQLGWFWSRLWPEAVRDFGRCGIRFENRAATGEVWRPPGREPVVSGLEPGAINLVITDNIPLEWDSGRALSGITTRYRGRHLCMIAVHRAHCHQVPLLSVNTCVHELLHAMLLDIYEWRPTGWAGQAREARVDWYATGLWLFRDGAAIRRSAQVYAERLRSELAAGPAA